MLDLYLIRHARTPRNDEGRYPARGEDPVLTPAGEVQARALRLPPGGHCWSSPARRCLQTAALAGCCAPHPSAPRVSPALLEADFGEMAGRTWRELEDAHGTAPKDWIDALSDPASPDGPPGGETGRGFHDRVLGWLDALPDGQNLAFTHAGVVLASLRLTVQLTAAVIRPARITHLRRAGGAWWLAGLNLTSVAAREDPWAN